ncbi:ATP-binding protein [Pseudorhodoferax sp. Leaf267]|uniref:ATP-binding protein n=1 Tax=Pseudorhodoferax sp. Leaf267 TaxID=1736316 RepID=UPI000700A638|nr:ATP-binding protein [Pseudorhodoferax sp. Leaf267]KQP17666.1 hypothetical protein ASF43_07195 [Pseudorhodoferax sp. Leaf267]
MNRPGHTVWRLRTHLSALLVVALLLSFALVLAGLLAYRVPRIEEESRQALLHEVGEMRTRVELQVLRYSSRLALLEDLVDDGPPDLAQATLDAGVGDGSVLRALYRASSRGRITAVGLPPARQAQRRDLLGNDLSGNRLFRAVTTASSGVAWSAMYASVLDGEPSVALARRDAHGDVLVAELPVQALLSAVQLAAGANASAIWVVDRHGALLADTRGGKDIGRLHLRDGPLMQSLRQGGGDVERLRLGDARFRATVSHAPTLDWFFIGRVPVGLENPAVRDLVLLAVAALAGAMGIGLLVAPVWAQRLARPLHCIIERAGRSTSGQGAGLPWPRGAVAEFNRLSGDLEAMTGQLLAREQKSQAVFHAAPVPMVVADVDDDYRLLDVNEAWCREFQYRRRKVLGRTTADIDLWVDRKARVALRQNAEQGRVIGDARLRRRDGTVVLVQLHGRLAVLHSARWLIWAAIDVGPLRRIEQDLRELNQQLEARVAQRTQALAASNDALSQTVAQLRAAQNELVRAEKMAALGSLVAGVAHELNTPLGNGVMAVSAVADAMRDFGAATRAGVTRAELQRLVDSLEQGLDIAGRNLRRAADLVHSFKQVAVDQTSAQRRSFELGEVVREIVVSLRPSFSRTPYRVELAVPEAGLRLDSYPGALGQAIANLVQNAVLHGFDGRDHGTVTLSGWRDPADGRIVLRVADDGRGIPAAVLPRIFDPFMTTRMGRGGTGLGLHISYNAVANLLGGTLTVHSQEGHGAAFELRLPPQAPRAEGADAAVAGGGPNTV